MIQSNNTHSGALHQADDKFEVFEASIITLTALALNHTVCKRLAITLPLPRRMPSIDSVDPVAG